MQATDLDTPIFQLTPRQLFQMQAQWQKETETAQQPAETCPDHGQWLVRSMAELADALKMSVSTVYKLKRDGVLDEATFQYGKWVMFDVHKALEALRLSNRSRALKRRRV